MSDTGGPQINYVPRQDATPESEAATLAAVYRFILDSASKKAAAYAPSNGPDDTEESKNGRTTTKEYTN
jgi:hypothetical protein